MTTQKTTRKTDKRPTLTLKGEGFTPEFRALLNKAAKRRGMTQAAFVAEVLGNEARKVLQAGTPTDTPQDNPPPPPAIIERMEDTDKKLTDLAEQVRKLTEMQQRSLWQKLTGR